MTRGPAGGEPGRATSRGFPPLAEVAVSFGEDAERYERTRPGYPAELVALVLPAGTAGSPDGGRPRDAEAPEDPRDPPATAGSLRQQLSVLDVGAGTGTVARVFADAGCRVTGVEPDGRMADVARRAGFDVEAGTFGDWDPAGRVFDVVVSGQAWHWVGQRAGAVKAASVLRDGGRLAVFWNVCLPVPPVAAALADAYRDVDMGLDFVPWERSPLPGYDRLAGAAIAGIWASRRFGAVTRHDISWSVDFTAAAWADQVPTLSWHERLAPDDLARVVDRNAAVVDAHGGSLTMPYRTVALLADTRP